MSSYHFCKSTLDTLYETVSNSEFQDLGIEAIEEASHILSHHSDSSDEVKELKSTITWLSSSFEQQIMSKADLEQLLQPIITLAVNAEKLVDPVKKALIQEEVVEQFEELVKEYPNQSIFNKLLSASYVSLAMSQLYTLAFAEAEQSARRGILTDPNEIWHYPKLAIALLYQGKWEEAKSYFGYKERPYGEVTLREAFLEDLDALEGEGITHPDVAKARALLSE